MSEFLSQLETVNGKVNSFVWGLPMLILLVGTGLIMTALTKCFHHFLFDSDGKKNKKDKNINELVLDKKEYLKNFINIQPGD